MIDPVLHSSADGRVGLRVFLDQRRSPIGMRMADIFDQSNEWSARLSHADATQFVMVLAAGARSRRAKSLHSDETKVGKLLLEFLDPAQSRIASHQHFHGRRIDLLP